MADLYQCSHAYARQVLAFYRDRSAGDAGKIPWSLLRLFRRAAKEAG